MFIERFEIAFNGDLVLKDLLDFGRYMAKVCGTTTVELRVLLVVVVHVLAIHILIGFNLFVHLLIVILLIVADFVEELKSQFDVVCFVTHE